MPGPKSKSEADVCRQLAAALLPWFAVHARDLPWRHTLDPYAVWVSEIMLQQTQVKTVIPYFERWLATLPTPAALAGAPEERVLKLWEGLGYYTRARNLQKAARQIASGLEGQFPHSPAAILELPGIGRYTAGAIASIAFNHPEPILDGNVIRVLTRVFALSGDPKERGLNGRLWTLAEHLVRAAGEVSPVKLARPMQLAGNHSALNQALMELGATVCTPAGPTCLVCPLGKLCEARLRGQPESFPESAKRPAPTPRRFAAVILQRDGRWLVRQRPAGVVNAGFWEFPNVELAAHESDARTALAGGFAVAAKNLRPLLTLRHAITRYRITLEVFSAAGVVPDATLAGHWATAAELETLAFTSAHRKIVVHLKQPPAAKTKARD